MLIQQENQKMKERDDQYTQQLKDWRVQISQRKKARNSCLHRLLLNCCLGARGGIYSTKEEFTGLF